MTTRQFTVVLEPDEGGYHAYVPALRGCHSWGKTLDEARANIAEAMELHLEAMADDGSVPEDGEGDFVVMSVGVPVPG